LNTIEHIQTMPEGNLRATDRILTLSVKDGKEAKGSTGLVDRRLFTGDQQLHLSMNEQTGLWSFRYSKNALLPEPLQGTFTSFSKGYQQAEQYFDKRNVRITEVKD
jgi:hypothetical protein